MVLKVVFIFTEKRKKTKVTLISKDVFRLSTADKLLLFALSLLTIETCHCQRSSDLCNRNSHSLVYRRVGDGGMVSLSCPSSYVVTICEAKYGPFTEITGPGCAFVNLLDVVEKICYAKDSCLLDGTPRDVSDPCVGHPKATFVLYYCEIATTDTIPTDQKNKVISCASNTALQILEVRYRVPLPGCRNRPAYTEVVNLCEERQTCDLAGSGRLCWKKGQELEVKYTCAMICDVTQYHFPSCWSCSDFCLDRMCHPKTGFCYDCAAGRMGKNCTESCPNGRYGLQCNSMCSPQCAKPRPGVSCNSVNGACSNGCVAGFTGTMCDEVCTNAYGPNCAQNCSENCMTSREYGMCRGNNSSCATANLNKCNPQNGTCTLGCRPGYIGELCEESCPNGTYGENCLGACSSNCNGSLEMCHHETGYCLLGCILGYAGRRCDHIQIVKTGWNLPSILIPVICTAILVNLLLAALMLSSKHTKPERPEDSEHDVKTSVDKTASHVEEAQTPMTQYLDKTVSTTIVGSSTDGDAYIDKNGSGLFFWDGFPKPGVLKSKTDKGSDSRSFKTLVSGSAVDSSKNDHGPPSARASFAAAHELHLSPSSRNKWARVIKMMQKRFG